MRGVEAALLTWRALGRHHSWGQALQAEAPDLERRERRLAESLLFRALRRRSLWLFLISRLLRRSLRDLSPTAGDALILGLSGVVEGVLLTPRSLINAFVQRLSLQGDEAGAKVVNGMLRRCHEEDIGHLTKLASSGDLRDQALLLGFPDEGLSPLRDSWGSHEARYLMKLLAMRPLLSCHRPDQDVGGVRLWPSPQVTGLFRSDALLADRFASPALFQTESSAGLLPFLRERLPAGEGFCMGQPMDEGRFLAPQGQVLPLWHEEGVRTATLPGFRRIRHRPRDVAWIYVEAPSSESGRWARLPDRKWDFRRSHLSGLAERQERLLSLAVESLLPGGVAVYRTSSLFKEENEQVVARVLASRSDVVEWALDLPRGFARRGRPWGYYVLPETPWADGIFVAILMRRS